MRILQKINYKHKVACIIFFVVMFPFMIFGGMYAGKLWNEKHERVLEVFKNSMLKSGDALEQEYIKNIQRIIFISNHQETLSFILSTKTDNNYPDVLQYYYNQKQVFSSLMLDENFSRARIYAYKQSKYYDNEFICGVEVFRDEMNDEKLEKKILLLSINDVLWVYKNLSSNVWNTQDITNGFFYLYKRMVSGNETIAIVEIRIPIKKITDKFKYDIPEKSFIAIREKTEGAGGLPLIVTTNGIMSSETLRFIYNQFMANDKTTGYTVLNMGVFSGRYEILHFIPQAYLDKELLPFVLGGVGITVILIGGLFLLVEIVAQFLTRRLSVLLQNLKKDVDTLINNDDFDKFGFGDEFGQINYRFYQLIQQIKIYYGKVIQYEKEKKELELCFQQALINPHFLYNILSHIKWTYEDEKLGEFVDSIVRYYRIALNQGKSTIMVEDEIKMAKEYLKLQRFTYEADFKDIIIVEEEALRCEVINQILQPVVENAFIHGINGMEADGLIRVTARCEKERLILEVEDNGHGMDEETCKAILSGKDRGLSGGFGMRNVQKRIQLMYGSDYGINIKSAVNRGTFVRIEVPKIYKDNQKGV